MAARERVEAEERPRRPDTPTPRPSEQDAGTTLRAPMLSIAELRRLQGSAGNAAVSRLLAQRPIGRTPAQQPDGVGGPVAQRDCACGGTCTDCRPAVEEQETNPGETTPVVQRLRADAEERPAGPSVQRFDLNPLHLGKKLAEKALGVIRRLGESAWNTAKSLGAAAWQRTKSVGSAIWNTASSTARALGSRVKSLGTSAWNSAKELGTSTWNTAKRLGSAAWNTAKGLGASAWNTAKRLGSSAWNTAKRLGSAAWNGAKALGGRAWGAVSGLAGNAFAGLKGLASSALSKAAGLGRTLAGVAKKAASALLPADLCKAIGAVLGGITAAVAGAVRSALNRAKQLGAAVWNRAKSIGKAVGAAARRWAGKAKQFATQALSRATRTVMAAAGAAWNTAKSLGNRALSGARRAAAAGWNAAKQLGGKAVGTAKVLGGKILSTARAVGGMITRTASAAGRTLLGLASKLTGGAAAKVGGLTNKILGKAGGLLGWVVRTAKSLAARALNTAKSLGARALGSARSAASRAWQTAKRGASSALNAAKSAGKHALDTAKDLGAKAWTTAKQLGSRAATTATSWAGKAWNTAKSLGKKAGGAIRSAAGTVWRITKSAGGKVWNFAERTGRGVVTLAKKAGSGAANVVKKAGSLATKGMQGLAAAARRFCELMTKFGPFLTGLKKLIADPSIITNAIRGAVQPMIEKVPGETRAAFTRVTGQSVPDSGAVVQRQAVQRIPVQRQGGTKPAPPGEGVWSGIWRHLDPKLVYLKDHWWEVLKETGRQLLFPWEGMGKDLGELWKQIKKTWSALTSLHFSTLIDAVLAAEQIIIGILGRWWGWFAIAAVLIGAVIGAFFGGAGAIPGAAAGWEVAASVGEGLLIADIAVQLATIGKGFYNLQIQHDTGEAREHDLDQISNGGFAVGLNVALMLLGGAAVRFGKAIIGRVRGLRVEPPKVEPPKVEPPKVEPPKVEPPKAEPPKVEPPKAEPPRVEPPLGERVSLREKVKSPDNVEWVSDPEFAAKYDAEVKVDGHTYRRSKADGTWCRFSQPECGLKIDEIEGDVDAALDKEPPEVKPETHGMGESEKYPAGSPEHKAARWKEYQERTGGNGWDYERWSKVYEKNMVRAKEAHAAADAYHETLGWGKREVTVKVEGENRRLDIADPKVLRGVEYKTGYQYRSQENLWELARDEILVKEKGWEIEWVFEEQPSKPLIDDLDAAGIKHRVLNAKK
ncbi:MAG TPA: hypothetical protein VJT72_19540 [Pseudonocardiaceae bacterium]|nr:hypothetical protein [Pseudonocardiaceae bacterium]